MSYILSQTWIFCEDSIEQDRILPHFMWKSYEGIWISWNFTVRANQDCESQKSRWGCKKSIDSFLEVPGLVNVVPALLGLTSQVTITNWLALFICYISRIKYKPIFSVQGGLYQSESGVDISAFSPITCLQYFPEWDFASSISTDTLLMPG